MISTNRINKELKQGPGKGNQETEYKKKKTKDQGAKNAKHKKNKNSKRGGEPGGHVVGRLLCTVPMWVWLIACFTTHLLFAVCGRSVCDMVIVCGGWREKKCVRIL